MHRAGTYSDSEFKEQKAHINQRIEEKKSYLEEKRIEEFSMETALDFCFELVRDSGKTWKELLKKPEYRLRFQKMIFPQKVTFNGEKFGTGKMSLVFEMNQSFGADSSNLVHPKIKPSTRLGFIILVTSYNVGEELSLTSICAVYA
jgi:hypothetical protein